MFRTQRGFGRTLVRIVAVAGIGVGCSASSLFAQPGTEIKPAPTPPAPAAAAESLPKFDEIMEKFISASGGKENWAKIKSMSMTGAFELGGANIKGTTSMWEGEGGKMLTITSLGGFGEIKQGFDGETMWAMDMMGGPRLVTGEEREMMTSMQKVTRPDEWKKLFKSTEVVGIENVADKPSYKVVGVMAGESKQSITQFFDKETGLISKIALTFSSPQGEMPIEVFTTDYKEVGGVKIAHKTRTVLGGAQEMINTVEKVEVNPEIPADKFALPAEIKELKDAEKAKADKPKDEKPKETKPADATPAKPEKK